MIVKLTGFDWTRMGISILLIGLSALCVLRAVIAGIVYGDTIDLPGRLTQAAEYQHRAQLYLWICLLLQGLTTLMLGPTLRSFEGALDKSGVLSGAAKYALAFGISILGTGLSSLLFFLLTK